MLKNEQLADKRSFEGNCEILRTISSSSARALSSDIPARRKGVYLFYNPPSNFSGRMHVDRSCIFCGFLRVSLCGIVNQLFNFSVTGSCKKYSFVFHDRLRVSLVCWPLFRRNKIRRRILIRTVDIVCFNLLNNFCGLS